MGRSTTQQLINRAKGMNGYNNSGIATDAGFVEFFNMALEEMVDDIGLEQSLTINFDTATRTYKLPDDYYALSLLNDANGTRIVTRRNYDQQYPPGYWISNKGASYEIDLYKYTAPTTFTGRYIRYPAMLTSDLTANEHPEVPTAGETALCFLAIAAALRNNNQPGQAQYYEGLYKEQRMNVRTAATKARG